MIFEIPFTTYTLLSDRYARLSVPGMAQLFQEVAEMHSTATNIGYHDLIKQNKIWVLSRVSYRILSRMPKIDEPMRLRTWSKCCDGLMAQREFEILSAMNEVLVAGTSLWVVLDMKARRVVRINNGLLDGYPHENYSALTFISPKLRMPKEMRVVKSLTVEHSNIDKAQHVNNAEYLRWMMDLLPEEVRQRGIAGLDINYVMETRPKEKVQIAMTQEEGLYLFQITNPRGVSVNARIYA